MNEFRTIEERYAGAVDATDLTLHYERTSQIDTLTAAGMVGVKNALALSLWRWVYGGDSNERHAVFAGLVKWMKIQGEKRKWKNRGDLVQVVCVVADWYNDKVCRRCGGTGEEAIPGTPSLSGIPCPVCHGTGERSLDQLLVNYGGDWVKRGKELRGHMDELSRMAAGKMMAKMKRDIEDAGL